MSDTLERRQMPDYPSFNANYLSILKHSILNRRDLDSSAKKDFLAGLKYEIYKKIY